MKNLTKAGIVLSVIWLAMMTLLIWIKWEDLPRLDLNEWGDFLAGVMAPLALFWLVLGYLQQGEELRLNTEALKAQQEELGRQVAETAALVAQSERQAAAAEQLALATMSEAQQVALQESMEAMPIFRPAGGYGTGGNYYINLKNAGATVKDLSASCSNGPSIRIIPADVFEAGMEGKLRVESVTAWPFQFLIRFTDKFNKKHVKYFEMKEQFKFVESVDVQQMLQADDPASGGTAS
ncbi:MAG: hypothetical protein KAG82_13725 [Alcanivoracaceae bacterium]|nr:hypothetical protein [Alcanivoracaceae bacterium]